jgi:hypothetical protein
MLRLLPGLRIAGGRQATQHLHLKGVIIGKEIGVEKKELDNRLGAVAAKPSLVARDPSHDKNE